MAIVFEIYVEASDKPGCAALVRHFDHLRMKLLTNREITWEAGPIPENPCAMVAWSRDLNRYGFRNLTDALEATESGIRLYHHLKTAPPFKFARVAMEAELISLDDSRDWVERLPDGRCNLQIHCVLDEESYQKLGSPNHCLEFREGYRWNGYYGETYRPLGSSDQQPLYDLWKSLFPK